ncbi:glycoside hydrolase family 13 protein [Alicyclobacillus vulcanalis]|uniref:Glycosidase n=1 Tax=Alicyclobacillus vulcanalis TaxID=252246 RepID=A0A1N7LJZ9_9BACL|nr:glycoside hydrolase family 13 protein [Alicyclobacillus vulcanalis]SIS74146.1 Glycosidase [Alicyclobacillus vulcanalis]
MTLVWQHRFGSDVYPLDERTLALVMRIARCAHARAVRVHVADRYEPAFQAVHAMETCGTDGTWDVFACDVAVPTRRLQYAFEVQLASGHTAYVGETGTASSLQEVRPFHYPYIHASRVLTVPDWAAQSVAYQIFPDRFAIGGRPLVEPSDPWHARPTPTSVFGGNLRGITEKLPYLRDLGVNLVYLTPIFQAPSNHKYDTEDYFAIDPAFGTFDDLQALVQTAHLLGIRIVLDAVFNHAGFNFAPFQDVVRRGRASPYASWFFLHGDRVDVQQVNYETFATRLREMPKLNLAEPAAAEYFLQVARHYVLECDIDGWRFDVANEIDPSFWPRLRAELRAIKPDILLIGEIWHDSLPWLMGYAFDGVMNYPLRDLILRYAIDESLDEAGFAQAWVRLFLQYPRPAWRAMWNLLGSHDTERILTRAQGDVSKVGLALALTFTLPGIPMVYYGDEIGMEGEGDPDCRRGMVWDEGAWHRDLRDAVRRLARLKASHAALAAERTVILRAEPGVLHYVRGTPQGPQIHVAICAGENTVPHEGAPLFAWASTSRASGDARRLVIWESDR